MKKVLRCAVYTRKSTEEGLEQEFNSLDAQREAGEAYIQSQAAEGWKLVKTRYDDGGFSGGTLERPSLKRLMTDIERGLVDVIAVYKIDRLSRSLADFARLVEVFEQHEVTFVSVTQNFSTTTSMGRLTLNVLLSFAQFEREVTGERIRDKIAASKKKGMWMGGTVPLGYDVQDKKLVVNEEEAARVRLIYKLYLEVGSVTVLAAELKRRNIRSKVRVTQKGNRLGGQLFRTGALYRALQSRTYVGEIAYKGKVFAGEHKAIIDRDLWDQVQIRLTENRRKHLGSRNSNAAYLLTGLLFDDRGHPMSPHHAQKSGGRRYGYYVSQAKLYKRMEDPGSVPRVAAKEIEAIVEEAVLPLLPLSEQSAWRVRSTSSRRKLLGDIIDRVELRTKEVRVALRGTNDCSDANGRPAEITIPFVVHKRGVETQIHTPGNGRSVRKPDTTIVQALARSYQWRTWFERGKATSLAAVAEREGCTEAYIRKLLPVAFLAPDITEALLIGTQPRNLTLADLTSKPLPLDWTAQRNRLGFPV